MDAQERRKRLKHYFYKLRLGKPLSWFAIFLFFNYISGKQLVGLNRLVFIGLIISLSIIVYRLIRHYTRPDDATVDAWQKEDMDKLIQQSYHKLGINKEDEVSEPLLITAPVYWHVRGIDIKEVALHKGKDNFLRFSVYQLTIFHLHENILGSYICYYNFLRGSFLNETTKEYHYKDIVSVSTQETSSNYHLPDGQKLIHAQEFRLSVSSGESIKVIINPYEIGKNENAELPPTGADRAVSVIRNMLRTKKV